jgi:hypothetical protein
MGTFESIMVAIGSIELSSVQLVSSAFLFVTFVLGNLSGYGMARLVQGPSEPPRNCKRRPGRRYAFESVPDSDIGMALPSEPTVRARREAL